MVAVRELHTAVQLSKQWRNVISSMKPMGLNLRQSSHAFPFASSNSVVARHIASVNVVWTEATAPFLMQLANWLPNLTTLSLGNLLDQVATFSPNTTLLLPPLLEYLHGVIHHKYFPMIISALAPLSRLQTLELSIQLRNKAPAPPMELDFSPLLPHSLPQLRSLLLGVWQEADFMGPVSWSERVVTQPLSPSAVQFLRQLSLSDMNLRIYAVSLNRVLDQLSEDQTPCPLLQSGNLRSVNMTSMKLDAALLRSLSKFPSIQQLHASTWELTQKDVSPVIHLPQLTDVMFSGAKTLSPAAMIEACRLMPQLRILTFAIMPLSTALLDEMLALLPQLTSLSFQRCDGLTTLSSLLNHGIPQRLTDLRMTRPMLGATLPSSDLRNCIFPLKQLQYLFLDDVFTDLDSEFHSAAKQVNFKPKSLFPNLNFGSISRY